MPAARDAEYVTNTCFQVHRRAEWMEEHARRHVHRLRKWPVENMITSTVIGSSTRGTAGFGQLDIVEVSTLDVFCRDQVTKQWCTASRGFGEGWQSVPGHVLVWIMQDKQGSRFAFGFCRCFLLKIVFRV